MDLKNLDRETLEKILRKVVQEELKRKVGGFEKHIDKSGVGVVKIPSVKPEKFDTGNQGVLEQNRFRPLQVVSPP